MKKINHIVIIGFGNIAQGLLPLLSKHYAEATVTIFEKNLQTSQREIANEFLASLENVNITAKNFDHVLSPHLNENVFLLNLAVSVSSLSLVSLAQLHGSLYLDTCIEPWSYETKNNKTLTSNFELREAMKAHQQSNSGSTAILAHGANPGFISILLKKALLEMAALNNISAAPNHQADWAGLAKELEIQVIQISEHDSQATSTARDPLGFVSTWSADGLITECRQPAELGWGTHENELPLGAKKNGYAIEMSETGHQVRVKSWSPNYLEFSAFLLTHNEALSIAEYLTLGDPENPTYRPTVYYAYEPCDQTLASIMLLDKHQTNYDFKKTILKDEIISGADELGIFLISNKYDAFWLGSNLSIGKTRKQAKYNNATSLQVASSIIGGMKWAEKSPSEGIVESENLDWKYIYDFTADYWEPIVKQQVNWRPSHTDRSLSLKNFISRN
ncbi:MULTISPECIES: saccharopine dehydrogenase NADP-binding domain-containing protein [Pseudomonas]|uniref:saccharopine dehydrogenase NADP-binding domain-containing protein n=1 Tax=Pseudomonas TaxID=286 RepID=UPI0008124515|nr:MULTISPECIES: saccharopine dehydrogenase NADP-binding domain-containing protein [Pseudomonas]CRM62864.1 Homospermidine synthase [Pseudomonas sp. 8 R 14]SAM35547.1 Homospermidine synthase [Pseudomonas sp. 1 R 17]